MFESTVRDSGVQQQATFKTSNVSVNVSLNVSAQFAHLPADQVIIDDSIGSTYHVFSPKGSEERISNELACV